MAKKKVTKKTVRLVSVSSGMVAFKPLDAKRVFTWLNALGYEACISEEIPEPKKSKGV